MNNRVKENIVLFMMKFVEHCVNKDNLQMWTGKKGKILMYSFL